MLRNRKAFVGIGLTMAALTAGCSHGESNTPRTFPPAPEVATRSVKNIGTVSLSIFDDNNASLHVVAADGYESMPKRAIDCINHDLVAVFKASTDNNGRAMIAENSAFCADDTLSRGEAAAALDEIIDSPWFGTAMSE